MQKLSRIESSLILRREQSKDEVLKFFEVVTMTQRWPSTLEVDERYITRNEGSYSASWQNVSSIKDVSCYDPDLKCCSNGGMLAPSVEERCRVVLRHLSR